MDGAVVQASDFVATSWGRQGELSKTLARFSRWIQLFSDVRRKPSAGVSSSLLVTWRNREQRRTLEDENSKIDITRC